MFQITCNEDQLHLICQALEDWHRFVAGECELNFATSFVEPTQDMHNVRKVLDQMVRPYIVPELDDKPGASYGWDGYNCPNKHQRKAIAMSYGIYRQIRHFFALRKKDNGYSVYNSPTLHCDDQGPLIQIKEIENQ